MGLLNFFRKEKEIIIMGVVYKDISIKGKTKGLKRDGKWEIVDKKTGKVIFNNNN